MGEQFILGGMPQKRPPPPPKRQRYFVLSCRCWVKDTGDNADGDFVYCNKHRSYCEIDFYRYKTPRTRSRNDAPPF